MVVDEEDGDNDGNGHNDGDGDDDDDDDFLIALPVSERKKIRFGSLCSYLC